MGSSLCGHFLHIPKELTKKEFKTLDTHLKKVISIVQEISSLKSPTNSTKFIKSMTQAQIKKRIKKLFLDLDKMGVDINKFENDDDFCDIIMEDIKGFKYEDIINTLENDPCCNYTTYPVNKRQIYCYFAGEVTWGDSPESPSYNLMDTLHFIGAGTLFYKFCYEVK